MATAIGFALDAGSGGKELSLVFALSYFFGCIFAVLAVRQAGIFTAVVQPPLILFVTVPTAYFLLHAGQIDGLKDLLINCGYPLIERFPLMFFTSAAVLLIGVARWYYGMSAQRAAPRSTAGEATTIGLWSRVTSLLARKADKDDGAAAPHHKHAAARPSWTKKATVANNTRNGRPAKRATPSRSRHARPPETEITEPVAGHSHRHRKPRQSDQPPPAEPRRRSRTSSAREPREPRKGMPPADRRGVHERRRRFDDYQPREPHGENGNGTHHPISRVRYRGGADDAENRTEYRTPRRSRRDKRSESWEYDA
jgi:hypothetical protein